jgi:hypothetical protein
MFYVNKKELQAFPFDKLYEHVSSAARAVKSSLEEDARELHKRSVERKIQAIYASREDSYESNPEDDFPFPGVDPEEIAKAVALAKKEAFALFAEKYDMPMNASWMLPQFSTYIAKLPISKDETGKYDPMSIFNALGSDNWHRGLYFYATHPLRGDILNKQYTAESRNYSALVPLLLMPFKKFDNIQYSDWNRAKLDKVLDPSLRQILNLEFDVSAFSKVEILNARAIGLEIKSGKQVGQNRNPVTTHKLYGVPQPFSKLPWLAQVMCFQIWCAHPTNRTDLMILDWTNLDNMPEPLIEKNVIPVEKDPWDLPKKQVATVSEDLPWDL